MFTNNTHKATINAFVEAKKDLIKHPYYIYNNLNATIVDYYNINILKSTLDDSAKIIYDYIGPNCPLRFNYVKDFFLYGLEKIQVQLDNNEENFDSGDISGEAYILPNTLEPISGDFFIINHLNKKFLFQVTEVNRDTLEDGANMWKISYRIDNILDENCKNNLDMCLADHLIFEPNNVGTQFKAIIRKTDYDVITLLDQVDDILKLYYKELFYSEKVQTFIFKYSEMKYIYDPMVIEFIIRNSIMNNYGDKFLYVDHKIPVPATFSVDYASTIFRALETKDLDGLATYKRNAIGDFIKVKYSIFSTRPGCFYKLDYNLYTHAYFTASEWHENSYILDENSKEDEKKCKCYRSPIKYDLKITEPNIIKVEEDIPQRYRPIVYKDTNGNIIDGDKFQTGNQSFPCIAENLPLKEGPASPSCIGHDQPVITALPEYVMNAIIDNTLFEDKERKKYNILIKYFNSVPIDADDIKNIEEIKYSSYDNDLYFLLPMIIYCIEFYIKQRFA